MDSSWSLVDVYAVVVKRQERSAATPHVLACSEGTNLHIVAEHGDWAYGKVLNPSDGTESSIQGAIPWDSLKIVPRKPSSDSIDNKSTGIANKATLADRNGMAQKLDQRSVATTHTSRNDSMRMKIDRVDKLWLETLQDGLLSTEGANVYNKIKLQSSQLSDWRRQKRLLESRNAAKAMSSGASSSFAANRAALASNSPALVDDSIMHLIVASTHSQDGIVLPRTEDDTPATEKNTDMVSLLHAQIETETRLRKGGNVPVSASESVAQQIARGLHGGPSVTNESASDVSNIFGQTINHEDIIESFDRDSLRASENTGNIFHTSKGSISPLVQLTVDMDIVSAFAKNLTSQYDYKKSSEGSANAQDGGAAKSGSSSFANAGMSPSGLGERCELFISVYDAQCNTFISENVIVQIDEFGLPLGYPRPEDAHYPAQPGASAPTVSSTLRGASPPAWAQAVFVNVPRQVIASGKAYLVFRLFRRGRLRDKSAAGDTSQNSTSPSMGASMRGMLKFVNFFKSGPVDNTTYLRPLGVAVLLIPSGLTRLADGTPHRPSESLVLLRPTRMSDDSRFFGLHRSLIAERERDAMQDDLRRQYGTAEAPRKVRSPNTLASLAPKSSSSGNMAYSQPLRAIREEDGSDGEADVPQRPQIHAASTASALSGPKSGGIRRISSFTQSLFSSMDDSSSDSSLSDSETAPDSVHDADSTTDSRTGKVTVSERNTGFSPSLEVSPADIPTVSTSLLQHVAKIDPIAIVMRCFSLPAVDTFTDSRLTHLFAPTTLAGIFALPTISFWTPDGSAQDPLYLPTSPSCVQTANKDRWAATGYPELLASRHSLSKRAQTLYRVLQKSFDTSYTISSRVSNFFNFASTMDGSIQLSGFPVAGSSFLSISPRFFSEEVFAKVLDVSSENSSESNSKTPSSKVIPIPFSLLPSRLYYRDVVHIHLRRAHFVQDKKMTDRNIVLRFFFVSHTGESYRIFSRGVPGGVRTGQSPYTTPSDHTHASDPSSMAHGFVHPGSSANPLPLTCDPDLDLEFRSPVFYHSNAPIWDISFALHFPESLSPQDGHLLVTAWHASTSEEKSHLFSFSFLPLSHSSGVPVRDGVYSLRCYKPTVDVSNMFKASKGELGVVQPWYLVAPVVDTKGTILLSPHDTSALHPSDSTHSLESDGKSHSSDVDKELESSASPNGKASEAPSKEQWGFAKMNYFSSESRARRDNSITTIDGQVLKIQAGTSNLPVLSKEVAMQARDRHIPKHALPISLETLFGCTDKGTNSKAPQTSVRNLFDAPGTKGGNSTLLSPQPPTVPSDSDAFKVPSTNASSGSRIQWSMSSAMKRKSVHFSQSRTATDGRLASISRFASGSNVSDSLPDILEESHADAESTTGASDSEIQSLHSASSQTMSQLLSPGDVASTGSESVTPFVSSSVIPVENGWIMEPLELRPKDYVEISVSFSSNFRSCINEVNSLMSWHQKTASDLLSSMLSLQRSLDIPRSNVSLLTPVLTSVLPLLSSFTVCDNSRLRNANEQSNIACQFSTSIRTLLSLAPGQSLTMNTYAIVPQASVLFRGLESSVLAAAFTLLVQTCRYATHTATTQPLEASDVSSVDSRVQSPTSAKNFIAATNSTRSPASSRIMTEPISAQSRLLSPSNVASPAVSRFASPTLTSGHDFLWEYMDVSTRSLHDPTTTQIPVVLNHVHKTENVHGQVTKNEGMQKESILSSIEDASSKTLEKLFLPPADVPLLPFPEVPPLSPWLQKSFFDSIDQFGFHSPSLHRLLFPLLRAIVSVPFEVMYQDDTLGHVNISLSPLSLIAFPHNACPDSNHGSEGMQAETGNLYTQTVNSFPHSISLLRKTVIYAYSTLHTLLNLGISSLFQELVLLTANPSDDNASTAQKIEVKQLLTDSKQMIWTIFLSVVAVLRIPHDMTADPFLIQAQTSLLKTLPYCLSYALPLLTNAEVISLLDIILSTLVTMENRIHDSLPNAAQNLASSPGNAKSSSTADTHKGFGYGPSITHQLTQLLRFSSLVFVRRILSLGLLHPSEIDKERNLKLEDNRFKLLYQSQLSLQSLSHLDLISTCEFVTSHGNSSTVSVPFPQSTASYAKKLQTLLSLMRLQNEPEEIDQSVVPRLSVTYSMKIESVFANIVRLASEQMDRSDEQRALSIKIAASIISIIRQEIDHRSAEVDSTTHGANSNTSTKSSIVADKANGAAARVKRPPPRPGAANKGPHPPPPLSPAIASKIPSIESTLPENSKASVPEGNGHTFGFVPVPAFSSELDNDSASGNVDVASEVSVSRFEWLIAQLSIPLSKAVLQLVTGKSSSGGFLLSYKLRPWKKAALARASKPANYKSIHLSNWVFPEDILVDVYLGQDDLFHPSIHESLLAAIKGTSQTLLSMASDIGKVNISPNDPRRPLATKYPNTPYSSPPNTRYHAGYVDPFASAHSTGSPHQDEPAASLRQLGLVTWISAFRHMKAHTGPYAIATLSQPYVQLEKQLRPMNILESAHPSWYLVQLLISVSIAVLSNPSFPSSWIVLHACIIETSTKLLAWTGTYLASLFNGVTKQHTSLSDIPLLPSASSNENTTNLAPVDSSPMAASLWDDWIELFLSLLTVPWAVPESLRPSRASVVLESYGDLRLPIVRIFRTIWSGSLFFSKLDSSPATQSPEAFPHQHPMSMDANAPANSGGVVSAFSSIPETPVDAVSLGLLLLAPDAYLDTSGHTAIVQALHYVSCTSWGQFLETSDHPFSIAADLRLHLANRLVCALIDLAHCVNTEVASMAKEAYVDLIRAELTVTYNNGILRQGLQQDFLQTNNYDTPSELSPNVSMLRGKHSSVAKRAREVYSNPVFPAAADSYSLQEIERLTLDAIDMLVNNNGPSLVATNTVSKSSRDRRQSVTAIYSMQSYAQSHRSSLRGIHETQFRSPIPSSSLSSAEIPTTRTFQTTYATETKGVTASDTNGYHGLYSSSPENLILTLFASKAKRSQMCQMSRRNSVSESPMINTTPTKSKQASERLSASSSGSGNAYGKDSQDTEVEIFSLPIVRRFLTEIRTLYTMLSSISRYPATPAYEDDRCMAAWTLIKYLRYSHRKDLHAKYVESLVSFHETAGNKAEAAVSYLFHADLLQWDETVLDALFINGVLLFPRQTSAQRLETVLTHAVDRLTYAQCWEEALSVCKILYERWSTCTYEYDKVSVVLRTMNHLYQCIATRQRVFPPYYIVVYNASPGFPKGLRGKTFVYRGYPGEHIGEFEKRIFEKWPAAKKVSLNLTPQMPSGTRRQSSSHFDIPFSPTSPEISPAAGAGQAPVRSFLESSEQRIPLTGKPLSPQTAAPKIIVSLPPPMPPVPPSSKHPASPTIPSPKQPVPPIPQPPPAIESDRLKPSIRKPDPKLSSASLPMKPSTNIGEVAKSINSSTATDLASGQLDGDEGETVESKLSERASIAVPPPVNVRRAVRSIMLKETELVKGLFGGPNLPTSSQINEKLSNSRRNTLESVPDTDESGEVDDHNLVSENLPVLPSKPVDLQPSEVIQPTIPEIRDIHILDHVGIVDTEGDMQPLSLNSTCDNNSMSSESEDEDGSLDAFGSSISTHLLRTVPMEISVTSITPLSIFDRDPQGLLHILHPDDYPKPASFNELIFPSSFPMNVVSSTRTTNGTKFVQSNFAGDISALSNEKKPSSSRRGSLSVQRTFSSLHAPSGSMTSPKSAGIAQSFKPPTNPEPTSPSSIYAVPSSAFDLQAIAPPLLSPTLHSTQQPYNVLYPTRTVHSPAGLLLTDVVQERASTFREFPVPSVLPSFLSTSPLEIPPLPPLLRIGLRNSGARLFSHQKPTKKSALPVYFQALWDRLRHEYLANAPAHVPENSQANEFLEIWVTRSVLLTEHAFPFLCRRSMVVAVHQTILNPIQRAAIMLNERTIVLYDQMKIAEALPHRGSEQSFSQSLAGMVDAAVSGGISNFEPVFSGTFRYTHPEIAIDLEHPRYINDPDFAARSHALEDLRTALSVQVKLLRRAIAVHAEKCSESMLPLHSFLEQRFIQLVAMVEKWGIATI